ncbi:Na/Pi cotransporter family protein [bacterium]|nr:Na/Pi cotransporter family protein [bacterium]
MNLSIPLQITFGVMGGLGLFLYGMKQMSEGMQAIAGPKLRSLIRKVTDNRLNACGIGIIVTGLIQSSSVTTVMVVGMVNAGLMSLRQAIGVIMGTNIGTTVTAWLIALHIADYGLPLLGAAALVYLFAKHERIQYTAMMFLGLGMIFYGLELMKGGLSPLRSLPAFLELMSSFNPATLSGLLACVAVGALITAVVQSSSATVAITVTMTVTQVIDFNTAVALVLGQNIGTTITAFLSSLGTNTDAKRTAAAHIFFNITGVLIMIPLFNSYLWFLRQVFPETLPVASRIAFSHTFFNLFIVLLLLPLLNQYARLVRFIVPARKQKEIRHLTHLDVRMFDTPAIGLEQSYREIIQMSAGAGKMMTWLRAVIAEPEPNRDLEKKIFHREEVFDVIQKEVVEFISHMMTGVISQNASLEARKQIRMADEYETISDYVVSILKLWCRLRDNGLEVSDPGKQELLGLHDMLADYLEMVQAAVQSGNDDILSRALSDGTVITNAIKGMRSRHLTRLEASETSGIVSLVFMDILAAYRRLKDHSLNIAEALAGEK